MPKGSGGGGRPGRSGGGGGDAGQPGEVVREANKANDATNFRYEMDQMESGTRYANRNVPGATMLSEREIRNLEQMGSSRPSSRSKESAYKSKDFKGGFEFPKGANKGDTWTNQYGKKYKYTGSFWE